MCGVGQVAHYQRDACKEEAAAAVLERPDLWVDRASDIHQPAIYIADLEGLQLGAIHAGARLPASVACNVDQMGEGGAAGGEESTVIAVADLRDDVGGVVGCTEADCCAR